MKGAVSYEPAPSILVYHFRRMMSFLTLIGIPTLPTTDLLRRVIRRHIVSIAVPLGLGTDISYPVFPQRRVYNSLLRVQFVL